MNNSGLGIKFPGKNGSQIIVEIFGETIGKTGVVLIAVHVIASMGFALEVFTNSIKLYLLSHTPMYVVALVMILLGLYALTNGLKTISTLTNILFPQIIFWMGLLLVLPYKEMDYQRFLPLLSHGFKPVILGSLEVIDALYGFTVIAYLMPYFKDRRSSGKWIFPGIFIGTGIYLGVVIAALMVFGAEEIVRLIFPTLTLAKSIDIEFNLVERAESLFMIFWIISTFLMLTLSFFVSYENLKVLFPKRNKLIIYGQLPFIWIFLTLPENAAQINKYTQYINYLGRVLMLVMIPAMVLVTMIKERMKKYDI